METDTNRVDALVVAVKGTLGAIPVAGPIIAEVVGAIIPNQRIDRISRLVEFLHCKLAGLDQTVIGQRVKTPQGVDLLEDAFYQTARALSDERIEYVANVLAAGITEDEAKIGDKKFLMWLLSQLNDAEIILLAWFNMLPNRDAEFIRKHQQIIDPKSAHRGSSQEELDDSTLYEARKAHLVSLNLLRPRFRRTMKMQVPDFDQRTGKLKVLGYDVTSLGRMLLRLIIPDQGGA